MSSTTEDNLIQLSTLVTAVHRILEGQHAIETRLNEAISQSARIVQEVLEAKLTVLSNEITALTELHQKTLSAISTNPNLGEVCKSLQSNGSALHSADSEARPEAVVTKENSENRGQQVTELKPMETESDLSQELVRAKSLKEIETERLRREMVISKVMSRMNQAGEDGSDDEKLNLEYDSTNEWALDSGFDHSRQTRRSLSGFLHYFVGISKPNILIGHKGSRLIHPNSPFATGLYISCSESRLRPRYPAGC
jgi:hypothetical protein